MVNTVSLQQINNLGIFKLTGKLGMPAIIGIDHKIVMFIALPAISVTLPLKHSSTCSPELLRSAFSFPCARL